MAAFVHQKPYCEVSQTRGPNFLLQVQHKPQRGAIGRGELDLKIAQLHKI